jgi:hypothetical protein
LASRRIYNEKILEPLLQDISTHFEEKAFSLFDVHSFIKSLDALDILTEDAATNIISYLVESGYDDEDYSSQLGVAKGTSLLCRLLSV